MEAARVTLSTVMERKCSDKERLSSAKSVLEECFWGVYNLSPEQVVSAASGDDEWMRGLIFGKIVDNASHPTPLLLCLFGREGIAELLEREEQRTTNRRRRTRLLLIRANALGERVNLPQYSWTK